jgi:hypothetical protein
MKSKSMKSNQVKTDQRKSEPSLRALTETSEHIKARLKSRASHIDADSGALLLAIRNVGTAPLASVGWIMAMALTAVPARSSLPLWLKIAASAAREALANPTSAKAPTRASNPSMHPAQASTPRATPLEP